MFPLPSFSMGLMASAVPLLGARSPGTQGLVVAWIVLELMVGHLGLAFHCKPCQEGFLSIANSCHARGRVARSGAVELSRLGGVRELVMAW